MARLVTVENSFGAHADHRQAAAATPSVVGRALATLLRAYRVWRDTRELMAMSDQMLDDLGLQRGGVEGVVRYGRAGT